MLLRPPNIVTLINAADNTFLMERIERRSVAFVKEELARFDRHARKRGYKNRSEAIRDLIRQRLVEELQEDPDARMMATLTMIYNHHDHDAQHELTHLQHHAGAMIRSTLHIHMDAENCLEVLILEGKVRLLTRFADAVLSTRGVRHGKMVLTSA